jgi:hypothetical protein
MRPGRIWLAAIVLVGVCVAGRAGEAFVRRDGARLTLAGREYRAIGMNSPDLFASYGVRIAVQGRREHPRLGTRTTSVSLREQFPTPVWTPDTPRQSLASLLASQPEPLDLVSLHHYGSLTKDDPQENLGAASSLEALRCRIRCVHAARSPVFIGELGNTEPALQDDREAGYVRAAIDLIEAEGASLAAVWAWHLRMAPIHNVTAESHPSLLKRIEEFNTKYAVAGRRAR